MENVVDGEKLVAKEEELDEGGSVKKGLQDEFLF